MGLSEACTHPGITPYLFCGEGSHRLSRTSRAWGDCRQTWLFVEESSGPESCAGFS